MATGRAPSTAAIAQVGKFACMGRRFVADHKRK
jgi:hypothetical protein